MKILSVLWKIFLLPGKFILWDRYMHPPQGKIFQTGRQRRSLFHQILFSLFGWWVIIALLAETLAGLAADSKQEVQRRVTPNSQTQQSQNVTPSPSTSVRQQVF